jgi:hypothetical protein
MYAVRVIEATMTPVGGGVGGSSVLVVQPRATTKVESR